jgi:luciferase family oxidoreductase group 1
VTPRFDLSVFDQVIRTEDQTAAQAYAESIALAKAAEKMGYRRYWAGEHVLGPEMVCPASDLLAATVASQTSRIRVGSAGVLLRHVSPLKVAQNFRFLEALYPGRIDLGLARFPLGRPDWERAYAKPHAVQFVQNYEQQVEELMSYLSPGGLEAGVYAIPRTPTAPEVWLLGRGTRSAEIAAAAGAAFCFGALFSTEHGPDVVEGYRRNFRPSAFLKKPKVSVAVSVICARSGKDALRLAVSRDMMYSKSYQAAGIPSPEKAAEFECPKEDRDEIDALKRKFKWIEGDPDTVLARLGELAREYGTSEFAVHTVAYRREDRLRSYELLAKANRGRRKARK